jgi:hypothetical protein
MHRNPARMAVLIWLRRAPADRIIFLPSSVRERQGEGTVRLVFKEITKRLRQRTDQLRADTKGSGIFDYNFVIFVSFVVRVFFWLRLRCTRLFGLCMRSRCIRLSLAAFSGRPLTRQ